MKTVLALVLLTVVSTPAFASMECEKKLSKHFESLKINVKATMKSQDYLNGEVRALSNAMYDKTAPPAKSKEELMKMLEAFKKYESSDSRFNEIVRVCSAIRAFAEVGIPADEIELKTLAFQNGWSEGMREPLAAAIAQEITQLKSSKEISDQCRPSGKGSKPVTVTR